MNILGFSSNMYGWVERWKTDGKTPEWNETFWTWDELCRFPTKWKQDLKRWRGIYYIYDQECKKGYVGSASGTDNIYQRWTDYSKSGHGGNKLLKELDPSNFRFSILQIVPHNMGRDELISLEESWKLRLHTHEPLGLNGRAARRLEKP